MTNQAVTKEQKIIRKERAACADCVPTNWLDPLLSGNNSVFIEKAGTWNCKDIERLLLAIKKRIESRDGGRRYDFQEAD